MFFYEVIVANSFCAKGYIYYSDYEMPQYTVVTVSFGPKVCFGVVVSKIEGIVDFNDYKKIIYCYKFQLSVDFLKFLYQFSDYYFLKVGAVLELVFPSISFQKSLPILFCFNEKKISLANLIKILKLKEISSQNIPVVSNDFDFIPTKNLDHDQKDAVQYLLASDLLVQVLEGVTGSGKTLVALNFVLKFAQLNGFKNKILILVPEINLANGWESVIQKEFNIVPFVYHSKMNKSFKKSFFNWAISNEPGVIIGTRSALMIPYKNLECVVVDEEHSRSYRQDVYPYYHARDMAVLLGNCLKIKVLLISATPSLETVLNIKKGKYDYFKLSREPKHGLATVSYSKGVLTQILNSHIIDKVIRCFEKQEQVFFFLNRKGYSPYCYCNNCKNLLLCSHCDSSLTLYFGFKVVCHKCLQKSLLPKECPYCSSLTTWSFWGIGVEKLYEFLSKKLDKYKFDVITCDSKNIENQLLAIEKNEINGIIATQILAQGHDFKNIGLVVIVDADMGLSSSDFRSMEYTYQLWQQIRGRSGRHNIKGEMILQSFKKENKFLDLFKKENIYDFLLQERLNDQWPPFYKYALFKFKGKNQAKLEQKVMQFQFNDPNIFGPLYFGLTNKIFEYRFLIKEKTYSQLRNKLLKIQSEIPSVEIEIDPY